MPNSVPEMIRLGYIRKAHGIRGELCLAFEAEDLQLLRGTVWLAPPEDDSSPPVAFLGQKARRHHGEVLLTLQGVDSRDKAEALRRHYLLIPKAGLPPPAEGEAYLFSLPGLRVLSRDEDGAEREIGRIASADTPAGQEIWTILTPEGREILFPAAPDFVLEINIQAGLARIAPPPGLLALYLEK